MRVTVSVLVSVDTTLRKETCEMKVTGTANPTPPVAVSRIYIGEVGVPGVTEALGDRLKHPLLPTPKRVKHRTRIGGLNHL